MVTRVPTRLSRTSARCANIKVPPSDAPMQSTRSRPVSVKRVMAAMAALRSVTARSSMVY